MGTLTLLLALMACGDRSSSEAETPKDEGCLAMTPGFEMDQCLMKEIQGMDSSQVSGVEERAKRIQDQMIQGAAVSGWVEDNAAKLSREDGTRLCKMLSGRDWSYCLRRLSSPHLQR